MGDYEDTRSGRPGFRTISSSGVEITGVGTLFLSELTVAEGAHQAYGYIYDALQDEIRQIDKVESDTRLILKTAFSAALTGIALVCPDHKFAYRKVDFLCVAGGTAYMSGVDQVRVAMIAAIYVYNRNDGGLEPIAVNGTGTSVQVTTLL
jgi:hypothetical protein